MKLKYSENRERLREIEARMRSIEFQLLGISRMEAGPAHSELLLAHAMVSDAIDEVRCVLGGDVECS